MTNCQQKKKSPGFDGFTSASYKKYKLVTTKHLHAVTSEVYETKLLPPSFVNTYTVLILKEDDKYKLKNTKNYRPRALGNGDYNELMKVLARRLRNVISEMVGAIRHVVLKEGPFEQRLTSRGVY